RGSAGERLLPPPTRLFDRSGRANLGVLDFGIVAILPPTHRGKALVIDRCGHRLVQRSVVRVHPKVLGEEPLERELRAVEALLVLLVEEEGVAEAGVVERTVLREGV